MNDSTLEELLVSYLYGRYRKTGTVPVVIDQYFEKMGNKKKELEAAIEHGGLEVIDSIVSISLRSKLLEKIIRVPSHIQIPISFPSQTGEEEKLVVFVKVVDNVLHITQIQDSKNVLAGNLLELPHKFIWNQ